jgi:hypothetical protein
MGNTPVWTIPYPETTDPADVPTDMAELANRLETLHSELDTRLDTLEARAGTTELGWVETTSSLTVSATTEAAATTVLTLPAIAFTGAPVLLDFFAPDVELNQNQNAFWVLYDGATSLGVFAQTVWAAALGRVPLRLARRLVPSAGSHAYSVRAYSNPATFTLRNAPSKPMFLRAVG